MTGRVSRAPLAARARRRLSSAWTRVGDLLRGLRRLSSAAGRSTDWVAWHREYDDPRSRRSRRLAIVQRCLHEALDGAASAPRVISLCAGEGRDLLPVLAEHRRGRSACTLMVELDPGLAARARATADQLGLAGVTVTCADAGITDGYAGIVPADVVLACGVFGNVSDDDVARTIAALPSLCARGATVIWTRATADDRDVIALIRRALADAGFAEVALHAPVDETFRVGMNRLTRPPAPYRAGVRMFRFVGQSERRR